MSASDSFSSFHNSYLLSIGHCTPYTSPGPGAVAVKKVGQLYALIEFLISQVQKEDIHFARQSQFLLLFLLKRYIYSLEKQSVREKEKHCDFPYTGSLPK